MHPHEEKRDGLGYLRRFPVFVPTRMFYLGHDLLSSRGDDSRNVG
jgi:hypothetical protein